MKKNSIQLTVLIPCLNEVETIKEAVKTADLAGKRSKLKYEVVVADNGSKDGSVEAVKRLGFARIISVPIRGYGAALHWGIMNAKGDYVFFADADLSYNFLELKKFTKFMSQECDLVVGTRLRGDLQKDAMPFLNRYVGTPFLTLLIRLIYGIKVTDCNSGMRLIKKNFYKSLHMRNSGMEWASELIIKTALKSGKYGEVRITFMKDRRKKAPHLLRWSDGWRHLKAILLIKPNILLIPSCLLVIVAFMINKMYIELSFYFLLLGTALLLSTLAANLLNFAIDNRERKISSLMLSFSAVKAGAILTIGYIIFVPFIKGYVEIKLLLAGILVLFDMWIFLVETIKTHLINSLPQVK